MYNINLKTILIYFSQRNKYSMSSLPKGFFEFAKLKNQIFVSLFPIYKAGRSYKKISSFPMIFLE